MIIQVHALMLVCRNLLFEFVKNEDLQVATSYVVVRGL